MRFVPGFFEDTLPALTGRGWAIVRLDGDTYEATGSRSTACTPASRPAAT